ncbi:MAG: cytochrome c [Nevskia sp.]|nr:cytochrome c [Nevskia sp.]
MTTKNIVLAGLGLAFAASAHAEGVAKPDKVAVCAACHGENGVALQPIYPNLAGQQASYIEHALHGYQSGERKNPIMGAQASGLGEADIKQLAAWFSQQPAKDYVPDVDAGPTAKK